MSRKLIILIAVLEISLFLFLRFYNIQNSLFFFNDMGRDSLVLLKWQQSKIPPLLGPQTSVLPFNQSALYYYLIFPFYLLSNQSPLSHLYTNATLYIICFVAGLFLLKKHHRLQISLLTVFFLISIHPQHILQSRFVWNPSFVTPFIFISLYSLLLLLRQPKNHLYWLFSLSLAVANSLSFSLIPFLIAINLFAFFKLKNKTKLIFTFIVSHLLANSPTLAFELRHHFILVKSILKQGIVPQKGIALSQKIANLADFTFNTNQAKLILFIFMLLIIYLGLKTKTKPLKNIALISLLSIFIGLVTPISILSHYVFAYIALVILNISLLPQKISLFLLIPITLLYLHPHKLQNYTKNASRTYQQMSSCYQKYCQNQNKAIYVSTQSNFHPFHNGPEHRYILKLSGCQVLDIETGSNQTDLMAVIIDGGDYQHNITQYYELYLFGPSTIINQLICQDNLKLITLKKTDKINQ